MSHTRKEKRRAPILLEEPEITGRYVELDGDTVSSRLPHRYRPGPLFPGCPMTAASARTGASWSRAGWRLRYADQTRPSRQATPTWRTVSPAADRTPGPRWSSSAPPRRCRRRWRWWARTWPPRRGRRRRHDHDRDDDRDGAEVGGHVRRLPGDRRGPGAAVRPGRLLRLHDAEMEAAGRGGRGGGRAAPSRSPRPRTRSPQPVRPDTNRVRARGGGDVGRDGEHWYCRELFRADTGDEGITRLSVYCTGDWDTARVAEHAAAVTMTRP